MRVFMLLLFSALLLVASSMSFQDEMNRHDLYCEGVAQGRWPAYKGEGVCE